MPITRDTVIEFLRTRENHENEHNQVLVQELFPDVPLPVIQTIVPRAGTRRDPQRVVIHEHVWGDEPNENVDSVVRRARRRWPAGEFGGNVAQGTSGNVRIVSVGQNLSPGKWTDDALAIEASRVNRNRVEDSRLLLIMIVPELGRINYAQTADDTAYEVVEVLGRPNEAWVGFGAYRDTDAYDQRGANLPVGAYMEAYYPQRFIREDATAAWRTANAEHMPPTQVVGDITQLAAYFAEFREGRREQQIGWVAPGIAYLLHYPFRHGSGGIWAAETLYPLLRHTDAAPAPDEPPVPDEVLVNIREVAAIITTVTTTRQRFGTRLTELEQADVRDTEEVETLLHNLQTIRRREGERAIELRALRCGIWGTIRQALDAMDGLPDTIAGFRGVNSCVRDDDTKLVIVTHPYAMDSEGKTCGDRDCENCTHAIHKVIIPPIKITVDLTKRRYEEGVKLIGVDGTRRCHPHLMPRDYSVCWGSAGTMLAEHWGREDWTGFMRILLTWVTQNNPREQYLIESFTATHGQRADTILKGWIIPDPIDLTPAATQETTTA